MKTYSVTKSTVECYKIRSEKSCYWADITVDHNGGKGRISIASDFGSYQHYWGACGDSFKEFLCKIGIDYAADKFGADRFFDAELTIKSYKETVIDYRKTESIEAGHARKLWNEIKNLEEVGSHESEFCHILQSQELLMKFFDWCPSLTKTISPQFRNFWKEIWPVFLEELKSEKLVQV